MKELDYMVTRTYNDDGSPPNTQLAPRKNFVAPFAPVAPPAINLQSAADVALQHASAAEIDASALQGMRTVSETSTPVQRGLGFAVKGVYILMVTGLATYALTMTGASGAQVAWFFVLLSLVGVALLLWLDYSHSPIGGERFKTWTYFRLQRRRIDVDKEVQLAKVDAFREMVGMVYGRTNNTTD